MMARTSITVRRRDGATLTVRGRDGWALQQLVTAGRGCTPIDQLGPRWSGYVHKLRHRYGLAIENVDESHGGTFPGRHARYVLREAVEVVTIGNDAEAA